MTQFVIRNARAFDAKAIAEIYAPYVKNTCISFESDPPTKQEMARRIALFGVDFPYLVCEQSDKEIIGYAYASRHGEREAYKYSADVSVYINENCHKMGVGRALYSELLKRLEQQNIFTVYACVCTVNKESIAFHKALGFEQVGLFKNVGYKFGKWLDLMWLQKSIRDYGTV